MVPGMLWMLLFACLVPASPARGNLVVVPQSPVLEIGSNFTATCVIVNGKDLTANDLYWNLSKTTVPEEHYTKINSTAVSVTIAVTGEKKEWLYCHSRRVSPINPRGSTHGILLKKAYPPGKPENLSCQATQEKSLIDSMSCWWDPSGRQTSDAPTTYTLTVVVLLSERNYTQETNKNTVSIEKMEVYPFHMNLDIWVEAHNILGRAESEHLQQEADWFVKTNPPSPIKVISEESFPTSLLTRWTPPIHETYMQLVYEIRLCAQGDHNWTYVPLTDTGKNINSFRLQKLRPGTLYTVQVRCRNARPGPYWSNWSANATNTTAEDKPSSKPNLWKIVTKDGWVQLVAKDPTFSNGRITSFDLKIEPLNDNLKNGSAVWEKILVNTSATGSGSGGHNLLKRVLLNDKPMKISVTAINSVGASPSASLVIPVKMFEPPPVEDLEVRPHGDQLELRWKPSGRRAASEFVLEWTIGDQVDWQRESRGTTRGLIEGNLERFVCYNISVYPIYSGWIGKPLTKQAFLEQGVPSEGPVVVVKDRPGHNEAVLVWKEIPQHKRRGFITNYTIFYSSGSNLHSITVPANVTSYSLRSLSGNTKYDTWIVASTIKGSARGFNHSFTTQKYAAGEIEAIVVGVSLLFFFIVLIMMLLCIYKEDVIKKSLWPQIPNPGESTIGNWSPDYPIKAESPKDNCVSGITVLTVDVCDIKCVSEDDKASLTLKRDKYLSEEHSSGIGGSSCMSSPRHSVSDSDEGSDVADTTASTVQYSSVVAVSGYKGQTPSSKLTQVIFSRSESTQPLLDSEEHPDEVMVGSRQSQNAPQEASLTEEGGGQPAGGALDFDPIMEEPGTSEESHLVAPASTYMPQPSGYRPQ
ncbi:hypothetical protein fugu_019481 [Takifugu bimaculatus]|uniref:Fibronectin type-III domain-containing protein n=1 Tax=Takifugu bimaculatus TaxID=433685 RepID=A0A4Z2BKG0_9TELE|nr:hypothetical protein fugu_019481 [Takifugu bimaculatus]